MLFMYENILCMKNIGIPSREMGERHAELIHKWSYTKYGQCPFLDYDATSNFKDLFKMPKLGEGAKKWMLLRAAAGLSGSASQSCPLTPSLGAGPRGHPGEQEFKEHSGGLASRPAHSHSQVCDFSTRLADCSYRMMFIAQVKWVTWRFKPRSVTSKGMQAAEVPTLSTNMCKYLDDS